MVSLTLRLCNTVIRKCGPPVYEALGKREFLKNIETFVTGRLGFTVRDQALCLIQEWGCTFAGSPTLYYAPLYRKVKDKGYKFPLDESVAVANLIHIAEKSQPCSKKKLNKSVMFVTTGEWMQGAH